MLLRIERGLLALALLAPPAAWASTQELPLPAGRPAAFAVTVAHRGEAREIVLERHSLRAPGLAVRLWRPDGTSASFTPSPPATYRGHVAGAPGSRVFAHLGPGGLTARIFGVGPREWAVRPASVGNGAHEVHEPAAERLDCPAGVRAPEGDEPRGAALSLFPGQHLSQIAFDVDYHYFLLKGASVQNSVDAVEAIMNEVDFFFARDVEITYQITHIVVRTAQYYFPTGGGHLLDLFRNEWNTKQALVLRDQAHLMTNKSNIEFGGLAYVAAVCNSWSYGWSRDSANIVGHELGHNWGSGHCHDLAPCNNMCGGCFFVGPATKEIITAYRDSRSCLDDAGAYPEPLPPYAHPETLTLGRDELALLASETFDVLGNDHDGNLDPLSLDGFDAVTAQGGSVALSPGSGPDGRDELVYAPPGFVFPGEDRFTYVVGDGTGLEQTGSVTIRVPARQLVGYWQLDEPSGTTVADASNHGRHGMTQGGPLWVAGRHAGALQLDGIDDAATFPPPHTRSNTITLSAWIYRLGNQAAWAGLLFSRDENTIAGLSLGPGHELRYHWNGGEWSWGSGLVVPDQQWAFVALVVEPQRATLYLDAGSLQSAVHAAAHGIEEFDGELKLGHDPADTTRRFRGSIDEARVHDHALTSAEIVDLVELGGKAAAPNPLDGGRHVPLVGETSWLAGLFADSQDLYFGDDYVSVRDATPASPEYLGSQDATSLRLAAIEPGQIHAWRVDQRVGGDVVPGETWLFTRVATGGHWPLDETGGATASDPEGGHDGSFQNGVMLGQPGAAPGTGTAIRLDGVNDHVTIPALEVHAAELSITGWARREGIQQDWAGLVFSRAGGTTAGISTRVTGELRYHWNDGSWDWPSGLALPDGQWVFFALVVRPDLATIYLGQNGLLGSATHAALHGVEEFDGALDLGRDGPTVRYFKGWLDDVRVWRTALSPRDVERIYEQAFAIGSGEVPDGSAGAPLRLARAGSDLLLSWDPSCLGSDVDYGVYEGSLGDFTSHVAATCSTAGATSATIASSAGNRYYLVVPQSANREGSYGRDGADTPREPGVSSCLAQLAVSCQ